MSTTSTGRELTVGEGGMYARLGDAIRASQDGDTILVKAGDYINDFATIDHKITIKGVDGMARLVATQQISNGKAILVTNNDVTFENIEFAGAKVADHNGAGIRYQGGDMVVKNCYFNGNENGILGAPDADGTVQIIGSEFANNGYGDGQTHGIYFNDLQSLSVVDSYFHGTKIGHHIKSRAQNTVVENNRLDDADGTSSYSVDLPNGGNGVIRGNVIVQSAKGDNPNIIAFGAEGNLHSSSSLVVEDNSINDYKSSGTGVWNATKIPVSITGNHFYQLERVLSGPGDQSGNTTLSSPAEVDTTSPWKDTWQTSTGSDPATEDPTTPTEDPTQDPAPTPTEDPAPTPAPSEDPAPTPDPVDYNTITGTYRSEDLYGTADADLIKGGDGRDSIWGYRGDDVLLGENGNDRLIGGAGNDILDGGDGKDVLRGGAGDDLLVGGQHADQMYGGNGADTFLYRSIDDAGDKIRDFDAVEGDQIDISDLLTSLGVDGDAIEGGYLHLTETSAGTSIEIDANGGGDAFAPYLTVTNTDVEDVAHGLVLG